MTRRDDSSTLPAPAPMDELYELIVLAGEGELSPEQVARLEELVTHDEEACLQYAVAMHIQAGLWRRLRGDAEEVAGGQWLVEGEREGRGERGEGREIDRSKVSDQEVSGPLPAIVLDTSESLSPLGPRPSPLYVTYPFLFSNFVSFLILAVGALGAWFYQIDIPHPVAQGDRPSTSLPQLVKADKLQFVGRVTGMADVQWADVQTATVTGANVPLGRKYALSSGLMEISYDTGAKVILQGPAVYEVESRDGGFLSVGKLTARLEKRGPEVRGQGTEDANLSSPNGRWAGGKGSSRQDADSDHNESQSALTLALSQGERGLNNKPQSPIANPSISPVSSPLFTIHTPAATVTDLGTEFGVEVRPDHQENVVVLQGKVSVATRNANGIARQSRVLLAGETARIDDASRAILVGAAPAEVCMQFVRTLPGPSTPSKNDLVAGDNLVLWLKADAIRGFQDGMPMGYWNDSSMRRNNLYHASPEIPVYVAGASSGLNKMPVVRFKGHERLQGALDVDSRTSGVQTLRTPFTLFSVVKNSDESNDVVNRGYFGGGMARMAFGLGRVAYEPKNSFWAWTPGELNTYGQVGSLNTAWNVHTYVISKLTPHDWTWYLNGKAAGRAVLDSGAPQQFDENVYVGASGLGDELWMGDIAELMIFDRVLTETELQKVGGYLAHKYAIDTAWSAKRQDVDAARTNPTKPEEESPMKTR